MAIFKRSLAEVMAENPPRLVITYKLKGEQQQFDWGMVGQLPMLSIIGKLVEVSSDILIGREMQQRYYDSVQYPGQPMSLVIAQGHLNSSAFVWFMHRDIPHTELIGMIETIRMGLIMQIQVQAQKERTSPLLDPNGMPIIRGR